MKKVLIALTIIVVIAITIVAVGCSRYNKLIGPVSNDTKKMQFEITNIDTYSTLGAALKEKGLINDELMYKIYIKLNKPSNLQIGVYSLSPSMSLEEIINILEKGSNYDPNVINITFKEGLNMREVADVIVKNTSNTTDDVFKTISDKEYLQSLIDTYWFINDDILDNRLYYSLEGYLFPDTYQISKKADVKSIFKIMLDEMDKVLTPHKVAIEKSGYSIHEILTLASVVEKEGKAKDFENIAATFYNRLDKGIALQSCATAFYGMKMDFNAVGIATYEMINDNNDYNTYQVSKLPVGPIATPSKKAIEATINRKQVSYLYFLSDNTGVTYFFDTYTEHQNKQYELKQAGKWDR